MGACIFLLCRYSSPPQRKVQLLSPDKQTFEVEWDVAMRSTVVKQMLEGEASINALVGSLYCSNPGFVAWMLQCVHSRSCAAHFRPLPVLCCFDFTLIRVHVGGRCA